MYELLRQLFHIGNFCFWVPFLKQLLLRNCVVDFVEICNVYVGKMIIKAAKRIFNSDKICRSYSDLNFGVTFFWNTVYNVFACYYSALPSVCTPCIPEVQQSILGAKLLLSATKFTATTFQPLCETTEMTLIKPFKVTIRQWQWASWLVDIWFSNAAQLWPNVALHGLCFQDTTSIL